jgi:excisionase family DNA binding protein
MVLRSKKRPRERTPEAEKTLEVDASMQGTLVFRDPVNLRINGKFEGSLDTKGRLIIGQGAQVKADIVGEEITIAGKVTGNVVAKKRLELVAPCILRGNIQTPSLKVQEGALLEGRCCMSIGSGSSFLPEELAKYLEVDINSILQWAKEGKIPAIREGDSWRFPRDEIESWISEGKMI